jgi:hypothetical protein
MKRLPRLYEQRIWQVLFSSKKVDSQDKEERRGFTDDKEERRGFTDESLRKKVKMRGGKKRVDNGKGTGQKVESLPLTHKYEVISGLAQCPDTKLARVWGRGKRDDRGGYSKSTVLDKFSVDSRRLSAICRPCLDSTSR